jgi:DNA-directed RNA polymerase sigma subunit (sigma70/sigma32)
MYNQTQVSAAPLDLVEARIGLPDESTRTLQSIGQQLSLPSERMGQIQAEALGKLRNLLAPQEH